MTLLPFNVKTLAMCGLIVLLTACTQPTKTENQTQKTVETTQATSNPHAGHDMSHRNGMASSTTQTQSATQPAHVTEYLQSMTAMSEQMMAASKIANPDVAFATGMIAHHQGAIAMAQIQLKYGKDNQMQTLAENIIKAQQAEITQMQTWLEKHKNDKAPIHATMPEMAMSHDTNASHDAMMQGVMNPDSDIAFAKGMIPHHQGAIDMANMELKMGKDNTMLTFAKQIKAAQDPEIKQMQTWLAGKGVK